MDGKVEYLVLFIVCCCVSEPHVTMYFVCVDSQALKLPGLHFKLQRTDALNLNLDPRTHNLVPAVDGVDELATSIEATRTAEGMCERGIGREVCGDGCFLLFRRALRELVDYGRNILHWVVHSARFWWCEWEVEIWTVLA